MAKKQDIELFGYKMPKGKKLKDATKKLLEDKPKEKTLGRGKFNLNKVYGAYDYADVGEQIEKDGLLKPTMAETASLVYDVFSNSINDKYCTQIKKIMKNKCLWTFTGVLYIPKKGAYIQDNPRIINGEPCMEESDLVKKLQKKDKGVRFVPFGYKIEEMGVLEFAKNPFLKALAGEEGAEKLAEVADQYNKDKPYLWSLESIDQALTSVSTVGSDWYLVDHRLVVNGGSSSYNWGGCVFGVQKNTKEEK